APGSPSRAAAPAPARGRRAHQPSNAPALAPHRLGWTQRQRRSVRGDAQASRAPGRRTRRRRAPVARRPRPPATEDRAETPRTQSPPWTSPPPARGQSVNNEDSEESLSEE